jgi:hypothetical protein
LISEGSLASIKTDLTFLQLAYLGTSFGHQETFAVGVRLISFNRFQMFAGGWEKLLGHFQSRH